MLRNRFRIIAILLTVICVLAFVKEPTLPELINKQLQTQLKGVITSVKSLEKGIFANKNDKDLITLFNNSRIQYKKIAVLLDYYFKYESKYINGPPIQKIEGDEIDNPVAPSGFQMIEQNIFSNNFKSKKKETLELIKNLLATLSKIENNKETGQYKEYNIWEALRLQYISVITLGITGYDSPIALQSLPEAAASLEGCSNIIALMQNYYPAKHRNQINELVFENNKAIAYLKKAKDFNSFNRIDFITTHFNPIYKKLFDITKSLEIAIPQGRQPYTFTTDNFFTKDFFNVNFFGPDYEYKVTPERIALGKKLFNDKILSSTNTRSCASCHIPEKGFTDGLAKPYDIHDNSIVLDRNTPTLLYSGLQKNQFWDSRTDILENQLGEVVHSKAEMDGSLLESAKKLNTDGVYLAQFKAAYPNEKEAINTFNIANAMSVYIRSLQTFSNPVDNYLTGERKQLPANVKRGFNLFAGKAKCATCHFIPIYNGLLPPFFNDSESEILGVAQSGVAIKKAKLDEDKGKYLFTSAAIDLYSFKTPTLRNIALTGPYMHNGAYQTLAQVMDFYNNGGGAGLQINLPNQTLPTDKLGLTKQEINDVISFMKALTDKQIQ